MTAGAKQLLVASRNAKKLIELRRVLEAAGISGVEVLGLGDVPPFPEQPETAATFEGNALAKARDAVAATGLATIADDSGIEVDALNAMPGVLSARWAGDHGDDTANNALLLAQLRDVPDERRGAAFVSTCAFVVPAGQETVVRGVWAGAVARAPRGAGGFGYDPLFVPVEPGDGRSAAELTAQEKDAVSHRGRALAQLVPLIARWAGQGTP